MSDLTPEDVHGVDFASWRLRHVMLKHGASPLNDTQTEALAVFISGLLKKIDSLGAKCDELQEQIEYMEQHPKGCLCRECCIP